MKTKLAKVNKAHHEKLVAAALAPGREESFPWRARIDAAQEAFRVAVQKAFAARVMYTLLQRVTTGAFAVRMDQLKESPNGEEVTLRYEHNGRKLQATTALKPHVGYFEPHRLLRRFSVQLDVNPKRHHPWRGMWRWQLASVRLEVSADDVMQTPPNPDPLLKKLDKYVALVAEDVQRRLETRVREVKAQSAETLLEERVKVALRDWNHNVLVLRGAAESATHFRLTAHDASRHDPTFQVPQLSVSFTASECMPEQAARRMVQLWEKWAEMQRALHEVQATLK